MTVDEFYEYCLKNGFADYEIQVDFPGTLSPYVLSEKDIEGWTNDKKVCLYAEYGGEEEVEYD